MPIHSKIAFLRTTIRLASISLSLAFAISAPLAYASSVTTYAHIPGEPTSSTFSAAVSADGINFSTTQVYVATVQEYVGYGTGVPAQGTASFTNFDFSGTVTVRVTDDAGSVSNAVVLPTSAHITPTISGDMVSFTISAAGQYVLEVNGDPLNSMQIFANGGQGTLPTCDGLSDCTWGVLHNNYPTTGVNLLYYGPGSYKVYGTQQIPANTTVYVDGAAAVYGYQGTSVSCGANIYPSSCGSCVPLPPCSTNEWDPGGCINGTAGACVQPGAPVFEFQGSGIIVEGRGILDGSNMPRLGSNNILLAEKANGIQFSGLTLRDSGQWTFHFDESGGTSEANSVISDIKVFGWRLNSDGVDIDSSQHVTLKDSYLRTFDDLVAVKSDHTNSADTTSNVTVENMVLWNEKAHALTVGTETLQQVNSVVFENSDIIRDTGQVWLLAVDNAYGGTVENITFSNINIEQVNGLITLTEPWLSHNSTTPGNISNVTFSGITSPFPPSTVPDTKCYTYMDSCYDAPTPRSTPPASISAYGAIGANYYEINTVNLTGVSLAGNEITSGEISIINPPSPCGTNTSCTTGITP